MSRLRMALLQQGEAFQDLEDADGRLLAPLTKPHGAQAVDPYRLSPEEYDGLAEYYRMAGVFLHDHEWDREPTQAARAIWELHADGASCTRIARRVCVYRKKVHMTITRLRAVMLGLEPRRGPGRPREAAALRRHEVTVKLSDGHMRALERIAESLGVGPREAIRALISRVGNFGVP